MKLQSTKLETGMTIKVDAKSEPVRIQTLETTTIKLAGRGINGRKSTTDYGKVIINKNIKLGKRKKVEVI